MQKPGMVVSPAETIAGKAVTLTGPGLGRGVAPKVWFRLKLPGRPNVAAAKVVARPPNRLIVTVPQTDRLGSGGPVTVIVGTGTARRTADLYVNEPTPPRIEGIAPSAPVVPKSVVTVRGAGFGMDRFGEGQVIITAASGARTSPSTYVSWGPKEIKFSAPDPPSAADTEPPLVTVHTRWRNSNPRPLALDHALSVSPTAQPGTAMAGDLIRMTGRGFGYSPRQVTATGPSGTPVPAEVVSWRRSEVRFHLPAGSASRARTWSSRSRRRRAAPPRSHASWWKASPCRGTTPWSFSRSGSRLASSVGSCSYGSTPTTSTWTASKRS